MQFITWWGGIRAVWERLRRGRTIVIKKKEDWSRHDRWIIAANECWYYMLAKRKSELVHLTISCYIAKWRWLLQMTLRRGGFKPMKKSLRGSNQAAPQTLYLDLLLKVVEALFLQRDRRNRNLQIRLDLVILQTEPLSWPLSRGQTYLRSFSKHA